MNICGVLLRCYRWVTQQEIGLCYFTFRAHENTSKVAMSNHHSNLCAENRTHVENDMSNILSQNAFVSYSKSREKKNRNSRLQLMSTTKPGNKYWINLVLVHPVSYRFSAFWLRSSVVSVLISLIADRLAICQPFRSNVFLCLGERLEACFTLSTDRPGIALLPGRGPLPFGKR